MIVIGRSALVVAGRPLDLYCMDYHTAPLYGVMDRTGVKSVRDLIKQPSIQTMLRVVVYYGDGRARNSVATLWHGLPNDLLLEVVYQGLFDHKPIKHTIPRSNYDALNAALVKARFDKLPDQTIRVGRDDVLWMVKRATGSFYKTIVLSPHQSEMPYTILVNAVDSYIPEAIREIKR